MLEKKKKEKNGSSHPSIPDLCKGSWSSDKTGASHCISFGWMIKWWKENTGRCLPFGRIKTALNLDKTERKAHMLIGPGQAFPKSLIPLSFLFIRGRTRTMYAAWNPHVFFPPLDDVQARVKLKRNVTGDRPTRMAVARLTTTHNVKQQFEHSYEIYRHIFLVFFFLSLVSP